MADESYSLYIDRPQYTKDRMTLGPQLFFEDRLFLLRIDLGGTTGYREYESDYGIAPPPKYDEKQEDYISVVHPMILTASAVPADAKKLDRTGKILEDMAYMSHQKLRGTYIEYCVKGKYSRDDESADVLDMILGNYGLDLAFAFSYAGLTVVNDIRNLLNAFDTNAMSVFDKNKSVYQAKLTEIVSSLQ